MKAFYFFSAIVFLSGTAFAGTATIDFKDGTGLLNHFVGPGELTSVGGRAYSTGGNGSVIFENGAPVAATGIVEISMKLQPSTDATSAVGLVMFDADFPNNFMQALCENQTGMVSVYGSDHIAHTSNFPDPSSPDSRITLQYNCANGLATVTFAGTSQKVYVSNALAGAESVYVGVSCYDVCRFSEFVATGDGIPSYPLSDLDHDSVPDILDAFPNNPEATVDTDGDGIGDEWEEKYFGNLSTADATSDYDNDGIKDRVEFQEWYRNMDPTDHIGGLPVGGGALVLLAIAVIGSKQLREIRRRASK
jgi:hypothetical protein